MLKLKGASLKRKIGGVPRESPEYVDKLQKLMKRLRFTPLVLTEGTEKYLSFFSSTLPPKREIVHYLEKKLEDKLRRRTYHVVNIQEILAPANAISLYDEIEMNVYKSRRRRLRYFVTYLVVLLLVWIPFGRDQKSIEPLSDVLMIPPTPLYIPESLSKKDGGGGGGGGNKAKLPAPGGSPPLIEKAKPPKPLLLPDEKKPLEIPKKALPDEPPPEATGAIQASPLDLSARGDPLASLKSLLPSPGSGTGGGNGSGEGTGVGSGKGSGVGPGEGGGFGGGIGGGFGSGRGIGRGDTMHEVVRWQTLPPDAPSVSGLNRLNDKYRGKTLIFQLFVTINGNVKAAHPAGMLDVTRRNGKAERVFRPFGALQDADLKLLLEGYAKHIRSDSDILIKAYRNRRQPDNSFHKEYVEDWLVFPLLLK